MSEDQTAMFNLRGKVALITGGNSGVGLGMAHGLAQAGANIAVWGRNAETMASSVSELREHGTDVESFSCDVTSEEQVLAAMASTLERFGRVDSCFANAGFTIVKPLLKTELRHWHPVIDANLTGAFLTIRESVRHMVERGGGGKVIGISSIGTVHGMPGQGAYSATKAGIVGLIRSVAVEFARHDIQANTIMPGWILTPATEPILDMDKLNATILQRTPAHRWGEMKDLAGAAVYLASSASNFQTGDVLKIDGGYTTF